MLNTWNKRQTLIFLILSAVPPPASLWKPAGSSQLALRPLSMPAHQDQHKAHLYDITHVPIFSHYSSTAGAGWVPWAEKILKAAVPAFCQHRLEICEVQMGCNPSELVLQLQGRFSSCFAGSQKRETCSTLAPLSTNQVDRLAAFRISYYTIASYGQILSKWAHCTSTVPPASLDEWGQGKQASTQAAAEKEMHGKLIPGFSFTWNKECNMSSPKKHSRKVTCRQFTNHLGFLLERYAHPHRS